MVLGSQFENTFNKDEDSGVTLYSHRHPEKPHEIQVTDEPKKGVAYQGMFFDASAATGSKEDPLISQEQRRATVRKSLHLESSEQYEKSLKMAKSRTAKRDMPLQQKQIEEAGYQSGIPTHLFKSEVNVPTAVKKLRGSTVGDYGSNFRSHLIRVSPSESLEKIGEEPVTTKQYTLGNPIPNPNFHQMIDKYNNKKTDKFEPRKISHLNFYYGPGAKIVKPDGTPVTPIARYDLKAFETPEGKLLPDHSMNVFEGEGKDTDEYQTHNFRMRVGEHIPSYKSKSQIFHTRIAKTLTGEESTYNKSIYKTNTRVKSDTLVHEIGHSIDPNVNVNVYDRYKYDPVKEGLAQGFEDRFEKHKNKLQSSVEPSKDRAREFTSAGSTSYHIHNKKLAPTRMHAALYAAVRTHTAMADDNYKDIENRHALAKTIRLTDKTSNITSNDGNRLLLGHLYTKHQHVRDMLTHLKLQDEGEKAAEYYRSKITDAGKGPMLPGMDTHEL